MAYSIIEQGHGYTIAIEDEAYSSIPYVAEDRENGDRNHGFLDLADRPELASTIEEASRSPGLLHALEVINAVGSRFRTLGCECGLFPTDPETHGGYDRYIGSYIAIVFRGEGLNTPERIEALARQMLAHAAIDHEGHILGYEITITPLRKLFEETGCFELHVNAVGYGRSDQEAWDAFGIACRGVAHAFAQINQLPLDEEPFLA